MQLRFTTTSPLRGSASRDTALQPSHAPASAYVRVPKRRDGLIERELPSELVLYDSESDQVFLLNHVSAAIWDLCDGVRRQEDIVGELAVHWDASLEQLSVDVGETVARFQRDGLLQAAASDVEPASRRSPDASSRSGGS